MKILHTSDWHVGKRLGRHDRMDDHRAALDAVVRTARDEAVDLVLVSGDVFDRPIPPVDALALALETLIALGEHAPVVAIAGNHDGPDLFETLAPLLAPRRVHLVGDIKRPDAGGVLGPEVLGVGAAVACFPFLREGKVVDFMREAGTWYGAYAGRVAGITEAYNAALVEVAGPEVVPILTAHFLVNGVRVPRSGPRGEKELHMGEAYTATAAAIPPGPQYVAMGHIHAPQPVPGAAVPAEYAGSLLQLDFGEAGEDKRVVIVEVEPGRLAQARTVPLEAGRRLVRATGTWEEVEARADELAEAFVDLTVEVAGPDPTLGQRAADLFPFLVNVRPQLPSGEHTPRPDPASRPSDEDLYAAFVERTTGVAAPDELLSLFREVLEEAAG